MAWVSGLVILSSLPDIAFRSVTGSRSSPIWIPTLALLLLVLAMVGARRWSSVERLNGYLRALVALALGYLLESVVEQSSVWVSWNRSLAPGASFVLVNSAKLIPVTTLAVSLIGSGLSRADLFLAMGDLRALFIRIGRRLSLSWGWLLPIALLLSVGPVVANVVAARHPDFGSTERLLPLIPLILADPRARRHTSDLADRVAFRSGPLVRQPFGHNGHPAGDRLRLVCRAIHARYARVRLDLVRPYGQRCRDLFADRPDDSSLGLAAE